MEVEVLAEHIVKLLSPLAKILPHQPPLPILSNILIQADESFSLSATNLELGVTIKIPAKIVKSGSTTVAGRQFVDVINTLGKGKISLKQETDTLLLEAVGNTLKFQTIPKDEFPTLFDEKGEKVYSFSASEFSEMFSQLTYICSTDEARPTLSGVYIAQKEEGVDVVSTDGYRMARIEMSEKSFLKNSTGIIISAKLLNEVLSLKSTAGAIDLYLYEKGNQIVFETGEALFVGRMIEGTFPNYQKVIPAGSRTTLILPREEFLSALRVASVFARENANIVHVKIAEKTLTLYSKSQGVGEGEVSVEVDQTGEDNEIAFNAKFLHDFLRTLDDSEIIMEVSSALEPAVFRRSKHPEFLHIIMPVRVQG